MIRIPDAPKAGDEMIVKSAAGLVPGDIVGSLTGLGGRFLILRAPQGGPEFRDGWRRYWARSLESQLETYYVVRASELVRWYAKDPKPVAKVVPLFPRKEK